MPPPSSGLSWLLAAALALRLAVAAGGWAHPERLMTEEDSAEYVQLARNLTAGRGFTQAAAPPYEPDVRRTPAYPVMLAAVFSVPGTGRRAGALAGAVVSTITVLAAFRLAAALAGPAAAWWAALLLALDLTSASYATQLLTEPLFTLLLVLSVLPLVERRRGGVAAASASGLLSGLAALCRPIAIAVSLTLWPACRLRAPRWGRALRLLAIAVAVAATLPLAWTARNYRATGAVTVSSVAATNMYFHRAVYVEAFLQHRRVEDLRAEWERDFQARAATWSERERLQWMSAHGRGLVLAHPFVYAWVALRSVARMLTPDHIVLASLMGGEDTAAFRVLRGAGWLQLAIVYLLAAAGKLRLWRAAPVRAWVVGLPIAYFVLIGGPEMYPRFRVPLMPFVSVLAACGVARDPLA